MNNMELGSVAELFHHVLRSRSVEDIQLNLLRAQERNRWSEIPPEEKQILLNQAVNASQLVLHLIDKHIDKIEWATNIRGKDKFNTAGWLNVLVPKLSTFKGQFSSLHQQPVETVVTLTPQEFLKIHDPQMSVVFNNSESGQLFSPLSMEHKVCLIYFSESVDSRVGFFPSALQYPGFPPGKVDNERMVKLVPFVDGAFVLPIKPYAKRYPNWAKYEKGRLTLNGNQFIEAPEKIQIPGTPYPLGVFIRGLTYKTIPPGPSINQFDLSTEDTTSSS